MKVSLDLHDIYNQGSEIEKALRQKFDEAVAKKAPLLEIIPGKGSGQLKKHVLRFLDSKRSSMKNMRIEKPSKNFGTIKVHFNWNEPGRR
jgi:dsDNA-specific endonuclease/ATPase MutS2